MKTDGSGTATQLPGVSTLSRRDLEIIADMIDDARGYLVNKGFIKGRICLLGASRGTKCHIADCKGFGELAKLSGAAHDDEFYVRDTLVLAFEEVSNCIIGQILTENNETEEEICLDCGKAMYELGLALAEFGCEGAEEEAIGFFRKAIECVKGSDSAVAEVNSKNTAAQGHVTNIRTSFERDSTTNSLDMGAAQLLINVRTT